MGEHLTPNQAVAGSTPATPALITLVSGVRIALSDRDKLFLT